MRRIFIQSADTVLPSSTAAGITILVLALGLIVALSLLVQAANSKPDDPTLN